MKYIMAFLLSLTLAHPVLAAGNLTDTPENPDLVYDSRTGEVMLVPAVGERLLGFIIESNLVPCPLQPLDAWLSKVPFSFERIFPDPECQLNVIDTGLVGTAEPFSFGNVLPVGMSQSDLFELFSIATAESGAGPVPVDTFRTRTLDLIVVPEPSGFTLAGLAALLVLGWRRLERNQPL